MSSCCSGKNCREKKQEKSQEFSGEGWLSRAKSTFRLETKEAPIHDVNEKRQQNQPGSCCG